MFLVQAQTVANLLSVVVNGWCLMSSATNSRLASASARSFCHLHDFTALLTFTVYLFVIAALSEGEEIPNDLASHYG